jgi:hypothetical protein
MSEKNKPRIEKEIKREERKGKPVSFPPDSDETNRKNNEIRRQQRSK